MTLEIDRNFAAAAAPPMRPRDLALQRAAAMTPERPAAAMAALRTLLKDHPTWLAPQVALIELLLRRKEVEAAVELLCRALDAKPHAAPLRRLALLTMSQRYLDPQAESLVEALERHGIDCPELRMAQAHAALRRKDTAALASIAEAAFLAGPPCAEHLTFARLLVRAGEDGRARAWAERVLAHLAADGTGPALLEEVRHFLVVGVDGCGRERLHGSANVMIHAAPDPVCTIVVFTGLAQEAGIPAERLVSLAHEARANLVLLADPDRQLFLTGLEPLGAGFAAAVLGLRSAMLKVCDKPLLFLGVSGGGFAAIRYAVEIPEVERVLVFDGPTTLDFADPVVANSPRARPVLDRLRAAAPERMENLRPLLSRCGSPMPIALYYAGEHAKDRDQALNLEGVPGVAFRPIPGLHEHGAMLWLWRSGRLREVISAFVSGQAWPEPAVADDRPPPTPGPVSSPAERRTAVQHPSDWPIHSRGAAVGSSPRRFPLT